MRALCSGLFEFQFVGNYSQECPIDAIANFILINWTRPQILQCVRNAQAQFLQACCLSVHVAWLLRELGRAVAAE